MHGCNAGGCHGKADGQNGFHLCLFGYDPEGDFRHLTRDDGGRRLSALDPDASLLLRKATGQVPHAGGPRFTRRFRGVSDPPRLDRGRRPGALGQDAWSGRRAGRRAARGDARRAGPAATPGRRPVRRRPPSRRDRALATYRALDDSAASVDPTGKATLLRRAETDLVVRYRVPGRHHQALHADQPRPGLRLREAPAPERGRSRAVRAAGSPEGPAEPAGHRRGLPAPGVARPRWPAADARAGPSSSSATTTPRSGPSSSIRLLADRDFVRFWQIKLEDMLGVSNARFGAGAGRYHDWVHEVPDGESALGRVRPHAPDRPGRPDRAGGRAGQLRPRRPRRQGPGRADGQALPGPPPALLPVPRPPLRRLDAGRLLRPGRLLRQGRPRAPAARPDGQGDR